MSKSALLDTDTMDVFEEQDSTADVKSGKRKRIIRDRAYLLAATAFGLSFCQGSLILRGEGRGGEAPTTWSHFDV